MTLIYPLWLMDPLSHWQSSGLHGLLRVSGWLTASSFTLWSSQHWQLIVNPVDVLTSPRKGKLSRRENSGSQSAEDLKNHAFIGYVAEKKKMKNTLCWKTCAGKQVYSSLNRVNKAQEYQIKPENKVSYFCLPWEWKNCAMTGTCIVANRWNQE